MLHECYTTDLTNEYSKIGIGPSNGFRAGRCSWVRHSIGILDTATERVGEKEKEGLEKGSNSILCTAHRANQS